MFDAEPARSRDQLILNLKIYMYYYTHKYYLYSNIVLPLIQCVEAYMN